MKIQDMGVITENPDEWGFFFGDYKVHNKISDLYLRNHNMEYTTSVEYRFKGVPLYTRGMSGPQWITRRAYVPTLPFSLKKFIIDVECDDDVGFYVKNRKDIDAWAEHYGVY